MSVGHGPGLRNDPPPGPCHEHRLCLIALPAVFTGLAALPLDVRPDRDGSESAAFYHPHFRKLLECRVSRELKLTIRYQTVTFDAEGAKKMNPGQSWHLAGATIEVPKKEK